MLKKISKLWFCTDRFRYLAAEKVLRMAFDRSKQSITDINSSKKITYQLFHDKIFQELKKMVNSKQIDDKTYEEFQNMLIPSRGIQIERLYSDQQKQRLKNAQSKKKLFAFSLDSIMLGIILNQLFQKKNDKLKRNDLALYALYIVGTPGIGKSAKFIASKQFLDMRIRHIIKGGEKKQLSQFSENFKLLYFHILTPQEEIMLKTLQQVKTDFDNVPEYITEINISQISNFKIFMSKVFRAYSEKNIRLRLILDQINAVYNLPQSKMIDQIEKWLKIRSSFKFPVVLISSKNNPYLEKNDPIIYFANSSQNNVHHSKIILDNLISPQQKLSYSYSCLVFQLQKYSMSRTSIIEIIKRVTLPFMTHLSITNSIAKIFAQKSDRSMTKIDDTFNQSQQRPKNQKTQEKKMDKNQIQSSEQKQLEYKQKSEQKKQRIIKALNMSFDSNEIIENAKNVMSKTDFSMIDKKTEYNLNIIFKFLSFSCQKTSDENIKIQFKIKDGESVNTVIKELVIPKREYSQPKNYEFLSETNYFFQGVRYQKRYIFINTSFKEMENVRMGIMSHLTLNFLQNMKKTNQIQFKNLIKYNAGFIFQAFVCNLYKIGLSSNNQFKTTLSMKDGQIVCYHKVLAEDFFRINQKESYKLLKKKQNQFIKCYAGNQAFDFILTDYSQNRLRLILVDTTISNHPFQIIRKHAQFKKQLFGKNAKSNKTNFKQQILDLLKQEKTLKLELVFYVLTSVQGPQQFSYIKKDLFENALIQSMPDKNSIQEGQDIFNKFIDDLKKQKFDERVTIIFQKGHFQSSGQYSPKFEMKCDGIKKQQNYLMKNLAGYLFNEHRKVVESEDV